MPGNQHPSYPWPNSLVLMSAVAAATTRVRIVGAAVIAPFGLGELPAVRAAFAKSLAETVSLNSITWFRLEAFRTDPEIDRLHIELFGW